VKEGVVAEVTAEDEVVLTETEFAKQKKCLTQKREFMNLYKDVCL